MIVQIKDIETACITINYIEDVSPMLSKEEIHQFKKLALKWRVNFEKHKKETVNNMIKELE